MRSKKPCPLHPKNCSKRKRGENEITTTDYARKKTMIKPEDYVFSWLNRKADKKPAKSWHRTLKDRYM